MIRNALLIVSVLAVVSLIRGAEADEPRTDGLIGRWPLAFDAKEISGSGLDGVPHSVKFTTPRRQDGAQAAAQFDGRESRIEVADGAALRLGTGDFTAALWVHAEESLDDDLGDLLSKFDSARRCGFTLTLRNNCVTSSQANYRQLQFGIDDGSEPQWTDLGRPGNALLAFSLCVHDGRLYCGTCEPGQDEAGHVYRYDGEQKWTDLGSPDKSNSVIAMAAYRGELYVGTGKYRLGGSALSESENPNFGGGIFRFDDEGGWTRVGQLPEVEAVASLAVFQGKLYASSLYKPASFFRYEADDQWASLPTPNGKRVESLAVHNGYLWATGYDEGHIYRFDGREWQDLGQVGDNTQTYSFAMQAGRLHVGTWPSGKVFRLGAGETWQDTGRLGEELEVMGMALHNGQLYAGSLPLAEMFRHDGDQQWSSVGRIDLTPDVKYRRIWTCAQYQGRLLATTLPSGHVHALAAGCCVTFDHELPPGWQHVAAVRGGDRLTLYVNGRQVAESAAFQSADFDLANDQPLLIGNGPGDAFNGRLREVRLYNRALSPEEIGLLAKETP